VKAPERKSLVKQPDKTGCFTRDFLSGAPTDRIKTDARVVLRKIIICEACIGLDCDQIEGRRAKPKGIGP
jgi:hypothetical protein